MYSFDKGSGNAARTNSSGNNGGQQEASMPLRPVEIVTLAGDLSKVKGADDLIGKVVLMEFEGYSVPNLIRNVVSIGGRSFYSAQELHNSFAGECFYYLRPESLLVPVESAIVREASNYLGKPSGSSLKIYSHDEVLSLHSNYQRKVAQEVEKKGQEQMAKEIKIAMLLGGSVLVASALAFSEFASFLKQNAHNTKKQPPTHPSPDATTGSFRTPKSGEIESSVDRQCLTRVYSALHLINHHIHGIEPKSSQPDIFDPTETDFSDAKFTECIDQFLAALDKLPFRHDAKFELSPPLAELKKSWAGNKDAASKKFYSQVTKFLGDDALVSLPPLDWTPKKKPVVTDPSPSAPEPPKVVGTVSPEITEAGKRMKYFLYQINRSISQAGLQPPKLKLDSAESILKTLEEINQCLAQMQVSDNESTRIDGQNFQKTTQEVGSAWSMGVNKGLAAVEKLFPRVEE